MLTQRQRQILDYIAKYIEKNGYGPSLEEIKNHFKLSAISTVHQHVKNLQEKGFLKKLAFHPRSIGLYQSGEGLVEIPLMGFISAGKPIEPFENPKPIKVLKNLVSKPGDYYALKVQGDSMIDDGIWDNDIVVVKQQSVAEENDTVVALIDNMATLKTLKYRNKKPYLIPKNRSRKHKPIFEPFEIRAKMVGLIRNNV